jgi:hypothetical protein
MVNFNVIQKEPDFATDLDTTTAHSTPQTNLSQLEGMQSTVDGTPTLTFPEPVSRPEPTIGEALPTGRAGATGGGVDFQGLYDTLGQLRDDVPSYFPGDSAEEGTIGEAILPTPETQPTFEEIYGEDIDEDAIHKSTIQMFQNQIDAVNQAYDQMVGEARLEGEGRIGSQRAISARGGILGSDFAGAQKGKVQQFNRGQIRGLEAERSAKIGAILGTARQSAVDEIAAKNEARQQGAENYLAYLAGAGERRTNNIAALAGSLLAQGLSPEDAKEELEEAAKLAGIPVQDVIAEYYNQAAASQSEADTKVLSAGERLVDTDGNLIFEVPEESNNKYFSTAGGVIEIDPSTGESRFISGGGGGAGSLGGIKNIELTTENRRSLLGAGWSQVDIAGIENDVRQYGLTQVIENARNTGASDEAVAALQDAYGGEDGAAPAFLDRDYFSNLYGDRLEEAAAEGGYGDMGEGLFNLKDVDTEAFLDSLESQVNAYRAAGYTDQEILEQMQG